MKINITSFGPKDFDSVKRLTPTLRVGKNGTISFSKSAKDALSLEAGDKVKISQDNTDHNLWYVHKDNNGFDIKVKVTTKKVLTTFYSVRFAEMLLEWAGKESGVSFAFKETPVVSDGAIYWPMRLANEEVEEEENDGEETPVIPIKRRGRKPGSKNKTSGEVFEHGKSGTGGII